VFHVRLCASPRSATSAATRPLWHNPTAAEGEAASPGGIARLHAGDARGGDRTAFDSRSGPEEVTRPGAREAFATQGQANTTL
jgi:hypothetical protein